MNSPARHLFTARNVHTVWSYIDSRWANRLEHQLHVNLAIYSTKAKAVAAGRKRAKKEGVEHIVHDIHGEICSRYDYGTSS